jgi:predicted permease
MSLLRNIASGIRSLFRKEQVSHELDEELNGFLEMAAEEKMKQGMSRKDALRAVRLERGNLEGAKEVVRSAGWESFVETFWQDLRYGLRTLRKSPGFTAVAVLTLALGTGANTAIFSLLDSLVFRDLPVLHPEQLVHFGAYDPTADYPQVSLPMFEEVSRDQSVFSSTFAWWGDRILNVEANGQFLRANIWAVTENFYSELGAAPEIGRLLERGDANLDAAAPTQVAVLGYDFWQHNYGGARDIIGKILKIEAVPFTIVGVTRKGFKGTDSDSEPEVTIPLTAEPLIVGDNNVQKHLERRGVLWLDGGARLKSGITLGQARAELESLWPAIRQASMPLQLTPAERNYFSFLQMKIEVYSTGASVVREEFASPIYVLLAISGVVLLLACVNLASLMLSRAAVRSHEFAVRVALGAHRARLARQILTESLMISIAGTLAGFVLAMWASRVFSAFIIGQISTTATGVTGYVVPSSINLSPDMRVFGFTATVAMLAGVLFGLAPAWRAMREDPNSILQQGSRAIGRGTGRLGKWLIVAQVALSVVLVAGAGLFIRTLEKLRAVQPGFRIAGVLELDLFPTARAFDHVDRVTYFHNLTDRISALPGVFSAGMTHMGLGQGVSGEWEEKIQVHGSTAQPFLSDCGMVMPGFFRTENIALLRGRTFDWTDGPKAPLVAILSQNLAQALFPGGNALGQHVDITTQPQWQNLEVVGIVRDARIYDFRKPPPPMMYMATTQYGNNMDSDSFLIRTDISASAILPAVRHILDSVGRESVESVKPLAGEIDGSILRERLTAMLSAFFGALALLIAGIGLFGLMAYNVAHRTRELGIRFALGAQRSTCCA